MRNKRKTYTLGIILLVLFLGIGYAYLSTTLSINGTTDIDSNTWNVYWNNVQVTSGSVTGEQVTQTPTIDTNKTTVSFHVRLKEPGEFYEFTVDAVNAGTIDAMIDNITKTSTIPNYLKYTITYSSGAEISQKNYLRSNSTEVYKVRIEYSNNINPSDLPSTSQSISLSFGVTYIQANEEAFNATRVIFTNHGVYADSTLEPVHANEIPYFESYEEIVDDFGHSFFLMLEMNNNNIAEGKYVGFIINNEVYYIKGEGATLIEENIYDEDSIYFESNKEVLKRAFGENNCSNSNYYSSAAYTCSNNNLTANISPKGAVTIKGINDGGWYCVVHANGLSFCFDD
ncbi:MAG: hypothetical protein IKQ06_05670 [Bacilli bacterium]|nr:hypothetical protein [Bacilli bacterium]